MAGRPHNEHRGGRMQRRQQGRAGEKRRHAARVKLEKAGRHGDWHAKGGRPNTQHGRQQVPWGRTPQHENCRSGGGGCNSPGTANKREMHEGQSLRQAGQSTQQGSRRSAQPLRSSLLPPPSALSCTPVHGRHAIDRTRQLQTLSHDDSKT